MRRFVFVMIVVGLGIGILAAAMVLLSAQTPALTPTPVPRITNTAEAAVAPTGTEAACTLLDMDAPQNLQEALAIDTMYESMPMFQTPVAVVPTQGKPFSVGCIQPGD